MPIIASYIEKRSLDGEGFEIRMHDKEKREIEGYGIVFNKRFELWEDSFEEIAPESGAYFLNDGIDVLSCFNHDFNQLLGRTSSDTMRFEVDEIGVKYIVKVANTSHGNDVLELVERGDVRGSSFMFRSKVVEWTEEGGVSVRRIKEFSTVREMGPVVNPAYTDTTVAKRSLDDLKEERKEQNESETEAVKAYHKRAYDIRKAEVANL
jgi:HK97 family phage prohead protease